MRISIEKNGEVIWLRDSETQEGITSLGYLKDGTQQEIIAALEDALEQAKGQSLSWYHTDGVSDGSAATT